LNIPKITPKRFITMDEDWLDDSTGQGGADDPLVDRQWNRLTTRYSDASVFALLQAPSPFARADGTLI
jgi:hypothetical protein